MAKCFAGDMVVARSADAVQVFGGSGTFGVLRLKDYIEMQKSAKSMKELISGG